MIVYYCDRCKQEIKSTQEGRIYMEKPTVSNEKRWRFEYERYNHKQYCPTCMEKLLELVEEWESMKEEK